MWEGNVCVDLNTVTLEELQRITHIGGARAQESIALRPFASVDELNRVSGVGPAGSPTSRRRDWLACYNLHRKEA
jgi:DNA uptake protein ComE-like DNA-binding protein